MRKIGFCRFGARVMSSLEQDFLHLEGRENIPNESAVYLVKHQSYRDIWGMGVALYRERGASAHYLMKASLPFWMEWLGGIRIYHAEDVKQLLRREPDPNKQAVLKMELKRRTDKEFKSLSMILADTSINSSVVLCPEGHRYRNTIGPIRSSGINRLIAYQNERSIPFVPVGTEYRFPHAYFRFGAPRTYDSFNDSDAQQLRKELAQLSNCSLEEITSRTEKVRAL